MKKSSNNSVIFLFLHLLALSLLSGCAEPRSVTMMPAPVIYHDTTVDPFSHLRHDEKTTTLPVFFATNRAPLPSSSDTSYGNDMSNSLHLGKTQIRFGDTLTSWKDLFLASTNPEYSGTLELGIEESIEIAKHQLNELPGWTTALSPAVKEFTLEINEALAQARDKEIIIYVHGAKGSFLKSVVLAAEIDHFSGRDFLVIAFAWPSHQNILSYIWGTDAWRAEHSTNALNALIQLLAEHTTVERTNIICYSAGGKLVANAISEIHSQHPLLNPEELQQKFKLGTVLFTAADVSVDQFIEKLPAISEMASQVVVTVSDGDNALYSASLVMGGNSRIGMKSAEDEEIEFATNNQINNFEVIDLSYGQDLRGFDITGHHYWHRHPWASSDIMFLLRSDLSASRRGLTASGIEDVWYLSEEYPRQVRQAIKHEFDGQW